MTSGSPQASPEVTTLKLRMSEPRSRPANYRLAHPTD